MKNFLACLFVLVVTSFSMAHYPQQVQRIIVQNDHCNQVERIVVDNRPQRIIVQNNNYNQNLQRLIQGYNRPQQIIIRSQPRLQLNLHR